MPVYVDNYLKRWRGRVWSHLFAFPFDNDELHTFAQSIGLKREWFQDHPGFPHYDVTESIKDRAIIAGAFIATTRQMVGMVTARLFATLPQPNIKTLTEGELMTNLNATITVHGFIYTVPGHVVDEINRLLQPYVPGRIPTSATGLTEEAPPPAEAKAEGESGRTDTEKDPYGPGLPSEGQGEAKAEGQPPEQPAPLPQDDSPDPADADSGVAENTRGAEPGASDIGQEG